MCYEVILLKKKSNMVSANKFLFVVVLGWCFLGCSGPDSQESKEIELSIGLSVFEVKRRLSMESIEYSESDTYFNSFSDFEIPSYDSVLYFLIEIESKGLGQSYIQFVVFVENDSIVYVHRENLYTTL